MGGRELAESGGAVTLKEIRLLWCLESSSLLKTPDTMKTTHTFGDNPYVVVGFFVVVIKTSYPREAEGQTLVCQHLPAISFQLLPEVYLHSVRR